MAAMRASGLLALAALLLTLYPHISNAAQFSGDYLLSVCGRDKDGGERVSGGHIACQSYIACVLDYHTIIRALGTAPSVDFCVPQDKTLNDLQDDVFEYLLHNKNEHGGFIASPGVALGLFDKYPCE